MREFDHVGIPTSEKHAGELYVKETKVWITDPAAHPLRIEYLRYEPESTVESPLRDKPHVAFRVDNLEEEIADEKVILGPFQVTRSLRVVFILKDGVVFEFMEDATGGHWFKDFAAQQMKDSEP